MRKTFVLCSIVLLFLLFGCSNENNKTITEKEKLVNYLTLLGYECSDIDCKTGFNETLYLTNENFTLFRTSYINLTNGFIIEGGSVVVHDIEDGISPTPSVTWEIEYSLLDETYLVSYKYNEIDGDVVTEIARGTFGEIVDVSYGFPEEYSENNPYLERNNLEFLFENKENQLKNKWEKYIELSGIKLEKLKNEFEERN